MAWGAKLRTHTCNYYKFTKKFLSAQRYLQRLDTVFIVVIFTEACDVVDNVVVDGDVNVGGQRQHQKPVHLKNRQRGRFSAEFKSGIGDDISQI
jgi:hypothetical protein